MKLLLAFLAACILTGCGLAGPVQTKAKTTYNWPPQGAPTMALEAVLEQMDSPDAIASHLKSNFTYTTTYDFNEFLSPNQFIEKRQGCCTAYARFWMTALGRLGYDGRFVAIYGDRSSHAITIFREEDGTYRMASNDQYFGELDLDPEGRGFKAAATRAAQEFYGEDWKTIYVFDDEGHIQDGFQHPLKGR